MMNKAAVALLGMLLVMFALPVGFIFASLTTAAGIIAGIGLFLMISFGLLSMAENI